MIPFHVWRTAKPPEIHPAANSYFDNADYDKINDRKKLNL